MPEPDPTGAVHHLVDHLFRHQAGRMMATLTRIFGLRRLDLVEDAVQDALVRALRTWPFHGVPENTAAWLIQVARNSLLDRLRRQARWREKLPHVAGEAPAWEEAGEAPLAGEVRDDQLGLIFACCHPAIPRDGRVALTLKTVGGFSTPEIARAFLTREATMAQRLVRAKRTLRGPEVELAVPPPEELPGRLESVLEVLYLMFNEGYSAHEGESLVRSDLCQESIRLVEFLVEHPRIAGPTVHALAALFLFQASRLPARSDAAGELLLLAEQDRSLWDRRLIVRGLAHLRRAARGDELSPYHLEAEIASCHALAPSFEETDWERILACYGDLLRRSPSPVVALNRVVALAQVAGPEGALEDLERLRHEPVLEAYYPFWATRGELLRRAGDPVEAAEAYRRALALTSSEPVRRFLSRRLARVSG